MFENDIHFFFAGNWLILTACQPVKNYFTPKRLGIAYIVRVYLILMCLFLKRFDTWYQLLQYK